MNTENEERFQEALRRFDAENATDPNSSEVDGQLRPRELVYAERLSRWLLELKPDASEPLQLAARSQHLGRWLIPRRQFPEGRLGYLRWRAELKIFHAEKSGEILSAVGYPKGIVERVKALNLKQDLGGDPECQALEDALCLVFLEYQFAGLVKKTPEEKMLGVIRKTWAKMSVEARVLALGLKFRPAERALLDQALGR